MTNVPGGAMLDAALALLLDKAGGELRYTQSEYAAIKARRGSYRIQAEADTSGPGEPVIVVRIVPGPADPKVPVS